MTRNGPTITIRVFELRETVTPELILRLNQRPRAHRKGARERGVYVVNVQIERLRCHQPSAFWGLRVRTVGAFGREHQDQLSVIRHLDVNHSPVVVDAVTHRESQGLFVKTGAYT